MGIRAKVRAYTDGAATVGTCGEQVLGELRHIDTQCMWIRHGVRGRMIELREVLGTENPADPESSGA